VGEQMILVAIQGRLGEERDLLVVSGGFAQHSEKFQIANLFV
jgi:hypothetical protein